MNKPFILLTKKSKIKFVNGISNVIESSLLSCGRKVPLSVKFQMKERLNKIVGLDFNSKKDQAIIKKSLGR